MEGQESIQNLLNQMEEETKNIKWEEPASIQSRLLQIEEDIVKIRTFVEKKPRKNTLAEVNSKLDTILQILRRWIGYAYVMELKLERKYSSSIEEISRPFKTF